MIEEKLTEMIDSIQKVRWCGSKWTKPGKFLSHWPPKLGANNFIKLLKMRLLGQNKVLL